MKSRANVRAGEKIDQQINVAARVAFTPRNRAKELDALYGEPGADRTQSRAYPFD